MDGRHEQAGEADEGNLRLQIQHFRDVDKKQLEVEEVDSGLESPSSGDSREKLEVEEVDSGLESPSSGDSREQLEVEEVDSGLESPSSGDSSLDGRGDGGAGRYGGFTFDRSLASLHTYLGELDETHNRRAFLEDGALLTLPIVYLPGIVLFPLATLPWRAIGPYSKAAVQRAMRQEEAPYTIGVIHFRDENGLPMFPLDGTTAEIHQYRCLEDGSMNVVTRGQQRFRLLEGWFDEDDAYLGQVQIIQEATPSHIPKDAFGSLASVPSFQSGKVPRSKPSNADHRKMEIESEVDEMANELSDSTAEEGPLVGYSLSQSISETCHDDNRDGGHSPLLERKQSSNDGGWGGAGKAWAADESKWRYRAQRSAWPHWVYRMYDAYNLAQRAADMFRQMVELHVMDDLVDKPELLSFYIASKMPVANSTRQELLAIDGVAYRLQKEIQLLESIDLIRCKDCLTDIARRSDMLVMSTDGPISAYVNPLGGVHETLTLYKTKGLSLRRRAKTEHSWFPGYAWTIAECSVCNSHMGWLFTAVKQRLLPKSFWGVRMSQLAENSH